jgi:hypothetical protein
MLLIKALVDIKSDAMMYAYKNGLIADSEPWGKTMEFESREQELLPSERKEQENENDVDE